MEEKKSYLFLMLKISLAIFFVMMLAGLFPIAEVAIIGQQMYNLNLFESISYYYIIFGFGLFVFILLLVLLIESKVIEYSRNILYIIMLLILIVFSLQLTTFFKITNQQSLNFYINGHFTFILLISNSIVLLAAAVICIIDMIKLSNINKNETNPAEMLRVLKTLYDQETITKEEFEEKRSKYFEMMK